MKFLKLMLGACLLTSYCYAQDGSKNWYAKVGDTLEDYTFTDLANYPSKTASYTDFKGKWLVLDVWSTWCSSCIASFPKMDTLQRKFKGKVQFFMIGDTEGYGNTSTSDHDKNTRKLFSKLKRDYDLKIPVAFDSLFCRTYNVGQLPYIIIVNPDGKIEAVTSSIDSTKLSLLLSGKNPNFKIALAESERPDYNRNLPLLTTGGHANGGIDTSFLFRSLLTLGDKRKQYEGHKLQTLHADDFRSSGTIKSGNLECILYPLQGLYNLAFFGISDWNAMISSDSYKKFYNQVIFETNDSTVQRLFNDPLNRYSYSLKVPSARSNANFLMKVMMNDLNNYFDFDVKKEKRKLSIWSFEIADLKKVNTHITKGGIPMFNFKQAAYGGLAFKNKSIDDVVLQIGGLYHLDIPLINNTNHEMMIDLDLVNAKLRDFESLKKELEKAGFRIIKSEKEMECLVVYDRKLLKTEDSK